MADQDVLQPHGTAKHVVLLGFCAPFGEEACLERISAFTPSILKQWCKRENLLSGIALLVLTAAAWVYTTYQVSTMGAMQGMGGAIGGVGMSGSVGGGILFFSGWTMMMVAMMLPATLPLILLYHTVARQRLGSVHAWAGMAALLTSYVAIWAVAGLPVYTYALLYGVEGSLAGVLPALLLIVGGIYQFTALKEAYHTRSSSPLPFLMQKCQPGLAATLRLGTLNGLDCLGCCAGLMVGLVALGMMNPAWMLAATLVTLAEKTLPNGYRVARPLGLLMMAGGVLLVGFSLLGWMYPSTMPANTSAAGK